MLVLVLAQTAMPTAVYAKGFGGYAPSYRGGTYYGYYGGRAYAPARSAPSWGPTRPMPSQPQPQPQPRPQPQQRIPYVSGGAGTSTGWYYYPNYYPYNYPYTYPYTYPYYYYYPQPR
jgi:hypothetical protein